MIALRLEISDVWRLSVILLVHGFPSDLEFIEWFKGLKSIVKKFKIKSKRYYEVTKCPFNKSEDGLGIDIFNKLLSPTFQISYWFKIQISLRSISYKNRFFSQYTGCF